MESPLSVHPDSECIVFERLRNQRFLRPDGCLRFCFSKIPEDAHSGIANFSFSSRMGRRHVDVDGILLASGSGKADFVFTYSQFESGGCFKLSFFGIGF